MYLGGQCGCDLVGARERELVEGLEFVEGRELVGGHEHDGGQDGE